MTEVIPSPVNELRSGSLHATGAIIIITAITYRSPPTSLEISVILFFLLDDRRAAIPGLVKLIRFLLSQDPAARQLRQWVGAVFFVVSSSPSAFEMRVLCSY